VFAWPALSPCAVIAVKRFLALLLAVLVLLGCVAGCGDDQKGINRNKDRPRTEGTVP